MDPAQSQLPHDTSTWTCLECDYNLTGISELRCPECGKEIEADLYQRMAAGPCGACEFDDDPNLATFLHSLALIIRSPRKFAKQFPPQPDIQKARRFSRAAKWFSMLAFVVIATMFSMPFGGALYSVVIYLTIGVVAILAAMFCEFTISFAMSRLAQPIRADSEFRYWRSLMYYSSAFLPITVTWALTGFILMSLESYEASLVLGWLWLLTGVVIFAWWCGAVIVMVNVLAKPSGSLMVGFILVPVIGIASIIGGYFGMIIGWMTMTALIW